MIEGKNSGGKRTGMRKGNEYQQYSWRCNGFQNLKQLGFCKFLKQQLWWSFQKIVCIIKSLIWHAIFHWHLNVYNALKTRCWDNMRDRSLHLLSYSLNTICISIHFYLMLSLSSLCLIAASHYSKQPFKSFPNWKNFSICENRARISNMCTNT